MSGIFDPKPPSAIPTVNPADTQNRLNDALGRQLAAGGTNADIIGGNTLAPAPQQRPSTLTGIG